MLKATSLLPLLVITALSSTAQTNPGLYFRVTKCNNIKANVFVNDKQLFTRACGENLSWSPELINSALVESKNRLRFEIKNEKDGDYYGALTFELLAADYQNGAVKKFYALEIKLQDFDRFQMNIDNLIKKQGWNFENATHIPADTKLVNQRNRKDSLDYFFDKQDRFYVIVTAAKHALYSIDINDQRILDGSLHISALDDAYGLKSYPFFFLNSFDKSKGKAVLVYSLKPAEGKGEAFLEIAIQHYSPNATDPQIIAISKITCGSGEVKQGDFDITEPLRRHGYFNP